MPVRLLVNEIPAQNNFTIGRWLASPNSNTLTHLDDPSHKKISIEPKMMDVLEYLCENQDCVVSVEQLLLACWKGSILSDAPVQKCIAILRKKLGCLARSPSYIETVHRRGYTVIAPVTKCEVSVKKTKNVPIIWTKGSPYLGLRFFGIENAAIYFGRTKAIAELIKSTRIAIEEKCHFLLILGKSGSGKSSLIRAGLLHSLMQESGFCGIKVDQHFILNKNKGIGKSLNWMLIDALIALDILPPNIDVDDFSKVIKITPEILTSHLIKHSERADPVKISPFTTYKMLVVDQLEQFLLDVDLTKENKANFVTCLSILAQHSSLLIVAGLRNDLYADCAEVKGFIDLKDKGQQYDLQPVTAGEIASLIRKPAYAAGLEFETDNETGECLDDILLAAAKKHPNALPLLEYTLDLLYQRRNTNNELLLGEYYEMGGLEGAIAKKAESTFGHLSDASQKCWGKIMYHLVHINPNNGVISAKKLPLSAVSSPEEYAFIQQFILARLFVVESSTSESSTASPFNPQDNSVKHIEQDRHQFIAVAHEALLMHWQRVTDWIRENTLALEIREQIDIDCRYWLDNNKTKGALTSSKNKLNDAVWLTTVSDIELSPDEQDFILQSKGYMQRKRNVLFCLAAIFIFALVLQSMQIVKDRDLAIQQSNRAEAVSKFLSNILLAGGPYRAKGENVLLKDIILQTSTELINGEGSELATEPLAEATLNKILGTIFIDLGMTEEAEQHLTRALNLHKNTPLDEPSEYLGLLFNLSRLYVLKGEHKLNFPTIIEAHTLSQQLHGDNHKDTLGALDNIGTHYLDQGEPEKAETIFTKVYNSRLQLFGENHQHTRYSLERLGRVFYAMGKYNDAQTYLQLCLDKWKLAGNEKEPRSLNCMMFLGATLEKMGANAEAKSVLNRHVEWASKVLGNTHPQVVYSKKKLQNLYEL